MPSFNFLECEGIRFRKVTSHATSLCSKSDLELPSLNIPRSAPNAHLEDLPLGIASTYSADSGGYPALYYLSYIARHLSSYTVELLMFKQFNDLLRSPLDNGCLFNRLQVFNNFLDLSLVVHLAIYFDRFHLWIKKLKALCLQFLDCIPTISGIISFDVAQQIAAV